MTIVPNSGSSRLSNDIMIWWFGGLVVWRLRIEEKTVGWVMFVVVV